MTNILINGACGRMGQTVANIALKDEQITILAGLDKEDSNQYPYPVYSDFSKLTAKPDVIIDFSMPICTLNMLKYAKTNNIPVVIATTGFTDEQMNIIKDYSKDIPIFKSANMSVGINLMIELICKAAKILKEDADIEIIEKHHNQKVDAPSGTALLLADEMKKVLSSDIYYEYDRHAKREKRNKNEIGIHSIRGGNIVGEHSVLFLTENENLEITHKASDRSVFAKGAITAAKWVTTQSNGLYSMKDMLS